MTDYDSDQTLDRLQKGNDRFHKRMLAQEEKRAELAAGQAPFAIVLGCADSRVSPEAYFDAGLGEIFVVRVAGNIASTASIASVEYAVSNLGARLVVVMAHESCGAVTAALAGVDAGKNLNRLIEYIEPAIRPAGGPPGENEVDIVARRSARLSADRLVAESQILRDAVEKDGLRIVTAFASFTTGAVEFD